MLSDAQLRANLANSHRSTGPVSIDGKNKSSQNSLTHGLFAKKDDAVTAQSPEYTQLRKNVFHENTPVGEIQIGLAEQIARALYRLRRCDRTEDQILQAAEDPDSDYDSLRNLQASVDRARNLYQRLLSRAVADLRTLQTIDSYQEAVKAVPDRKLTNYPKLDKDLGGTVNSQSTERIWRSRGYFEKNKVSQNEANPETQSKNDALKPAASAIPQSPSQNHPA